MSLIAIVVVVKASALSASFKHNCGMADGTIDLGPTVTRLIRRIKGMEQSDPSCTPATVYPGAQIPTQCVVRSCFPKVKCCLSHVHGGMPSLFMALLITLRTQ